MSAQPKPQLNSRAESYRDWARQAINSAADYRAKAEWFTAKGDAEIAAEYKQLSNDAIARAERYTVLADFAEKTARAFSR